MTTLIIKNISVNYINISPIIEKTCTSLGVVVAIFLKAKKWKVLKAYKPLILTLKSSIYVHVFGGNSCSS